MKGRDGMNGKEEEGVGHVSGMQSLMRFVSQEKCNRDGWNNKDIYIEMGEFLGFFRGSDFFCGRCRKLIEVWT